jgi:hypothetical protein
MEVNVSVGSEDTYRRTEPSARNSKRPSRKNSTNSRRRCSSQRGTACALVNKRLWSESASLACTKRPILKPSLSSRRSSVYWKNCCPKPERITEGNSREGLLDWLVFVGAKTCDWPGFIEAGMFVICESVGLGLSQTKMFPSEVSKGRMLVQVVCTVFFRCVAFARICVPEIVTGPAPFSLTSAGVIFGYAALKPVLVKQGGLRKIPCKFAVVNSNHPIGVYADLCTEEEKRSGVWLCAEQDLRMNFMFTLSTVVTNVNKHLAFPNRSSH